ncbi:MAG: exodeoxyribonuclease V subunit alpha [Rudaea sp.]
MNPAALPERDIDRVLARWVRERSGSELLARVAAVLNLSEAQGHVCCALDTDAGLTTAQVDELRGHAWVGDGGAFSPFVLDDDANLYTWRNWRHETRLAQALRARAQRRRLPLDASTLATDVNGLFAGMGAQATRWQRAAVAAVPGARMFVLTGGPGTGKTTTALRMLLMLLRHASACGLPESPTVALAAPTGKAAQRLAQSIRGGVEYLRSRLAPDCAFAAGLERMATVQAQTLHRLLGFAQHNGDFRHNADAPLAADVVIVDEASMIDLAILRQLFDALRPHAVLILLGDPGQLYSVEAGCVLGDITSSVAENAMPPELAQHLAGVLDALPVATASPSPLAGQVFTLTHTFRAGSGLHAALAALRSGDAAWSERVIQSGADGNLGWRACEDTAALAASVAQWLDAHADTFARTLQPGGTPQDALEALSAAQILCALREGPFGAEGINALLTRHLAARFGFDAGQTWHHGRPVVVTHNDYARGLYNGDVGIALMEGNHLRVWFDTGAASGPRSFSPRTLPAHETAWAITIHRSQGSEYADVAVVLPPDAEHRILSRELVYTAVSRARDNAQIWASAAALRAAVAQPVLRRSGLRRRLG